MVISNLMKMFYHREPYVVNLRC